jgi:hypothetical protein
LKEFIEWVVGFEASLLHICDVMDRLVNAVLLIVSRWAWH